MIFSTKDNVYNYIYEMVMKYKKVKYLNLVGNKAFNRYREIDEEMKKELVTLLD